MDWKKLLKKYIRHVGAAEGDQFARYLDLAPCNMKEDNYTESERQSLMELFVEMDMEDHLKKGR